MRSKRHTPRQETPPQPPNVLDDLESMIQLEPEDLAGHLFASLRNMTHARHEEILQRGPKSLIDLGKVPYEIRDEVVLAIAEAWQWLVTEGLLVARPFAGGFAITRRGWRLRSVEDLQAFVAARAIPKQLLHAQLAQRVWGALLRGDYETAVFQAYREVEIAVRDAAKGQNTELGVPLMRKAFDKFSGPLADPNEPESEREALAHLFAGAVGRFKNPSSHRTVEYALVEATEALVLASLLLRIVEQRQSSSISNPLPRGDAETDPSEPN